ncbi:MAG TPA: GGDEF domain-containing protein, partial [Rhodospirillales bacterium]|nr:GGDEF domain-containing protein [Rhodospirillales bacterium]
MTAIDQTRLEEIFLGEDVHLLDKVIEALKPETSNIVNIFYSELIGHPDAGNFLDSEIVAERLTLSLCDWLKNLFLPRSEEDLEQFVAFQHDVGQIHARINVPMHLVVDGMRVIRRELCGLMMTVKMDQTDLVKTVLLINEVLDHVLSLMNQSYIDDLILHERNIHSLKMQVSPYNLAMECEKQRSFLFNWALQVTLNLFENEAPNTGRLSTLLRTEFGLWVSHKTPLLFTDQDFTTRLEQRLKQIDDAVVAAAKRRKKGLDPKFYAALHALNEQVSRTAWSLSETMEHILELESGRDALTRLFNRRFLPTVMRHETELSVKHNIRFGILLIDIDHFKKINDSHGHDAGDAVLEQLSETVVPIVRANDYLFRYGGEEFLAIVGDVTSETALHLAEKMRTVIETKDFDIGGDSPPIKVTVSIGIAIH